MFALPGGVTELPRKSLLRDQRGVQMRGKPISGRLRKFDL